MPLTPIPFARHSYTLDSLPATVQDLMNLYVEAAPADALTKSIVRPVPGLQTIHTFPGGPVRGVDSSVPGQIYYVAGQRGYRQEAALIAPPVDIGEVLGTGPVTFAASATQMVICGSPYVYCCDFIGSLRLIGNVQADSVTQLDGFFVFAALGNSDGFAVSRLLNAESVDPLDVAHGNTVANTIRRIITHNGQLWLMGEKGIEIWYNTGASFPFARQPGGFIPEGCTGQFPIATADGSVFWLGQDGMIYRSRGYKSERVSTHAIERLIIGITNIRATEAFIYSVGGHIFVVYNLFTDGLASVTIIYDCATGLWHRRSSDGNGGWRAGCAAFSQNASRTIAGDRANGDIYLVRPAGGPEAGVALPWLATLPPLSAHGPRSFMARIEIEMETGPANTPGDILLDWTDDGGRTFSAARTLPTNGANGYRTRVAANRLGSFRTRSLRLRGTGDATFYGADADITPGNS